MKASTRRWTNKKHKRESVLYGIKEEDFPFKCCWRKAFASLHGSHFLCSLCHTSCQQPSAVLSASSPLSSSPPLYPFLPGVRRKAANEKAGAERGANHGGELSLKTGLPRIPATAF